MRTGERLTRLQRCLPPSAALLVALLAALAVAPVQATPAGSEQPTTSPRAGVGPVRIVGRGDRSVVITLRRAATVRTGRLDDLGEPPFGASLRREYLGFAVSRLSDGHVLVGQLRSRFLENELGVPGTVPLGSARRLEPGRYRLSLFGTGRTVVEIQASGLPRTIRLGRGTPVPLSLRVGYLSQEAGDVHPTRRVPHRSTGAEFFAYGLAERTDAPVNHSASHACRVDPAVDTCAGHVVAGDATGTAPLTASAGGVMAWDQPGTVAPGRHDLLYEATSGSVAARTAYVFACFPSIPSRRHGCPD